MDTKMLEKAKAILMSTPMVQASMRDINPKTQTRRVVNIPNWTTDSYDELFIDVHGNLCATCDDTGCDAVIKPRYQPGDILWVRETWYYENHMHDLTAGEPDLPSGAYSRRYIFRAECPEYPVNLGVGGNGWKPSIHMPREAARLFLRVTDVRAERVQDISDADCNAEGIKSYWLTKEAGKNADDWHESNGPPFIGAAKELGADLCSTRCEAYQQLWDSLNAKRNGGKYAWDSNPWVWVYTFERCKKPARW